LKKKRTGREYKENKKINWKGRCEEKNAEKKIR
jgi:hypothetical protein